MPRRSRAKRPRPETEEERWKRIDLRLAAVLKDKDARMRLWMAFGAPGGELDE